MKRGRTGVQGSMQWVLPRIRPGLLHTLKNEPVAPEPKKRDGRLTKFPRDVIAAVRWDREHCGTSYAALATKYELPLWRIKQIIRYYVAADVEPAELVVARDYA